MGTIRLAANSVLRPNPDVVLTEMGDGTAVLLHMQTRFYFTLNVTGAFVWKLLAAPDKAWDTGLLAEEVVREFEADHAAVTADVSALLEELRAEELLASAPG